MWGLRDRQIVMKIVKRIGSGFTRRREAAKFRLEKDNSCHILIHYQSDMGETEPK